ncbi:MAG: hypothetical protein M0R48_08675 [Candidatus Omnitrophica bacterium]|nr:hypothetical protein [Candidatus Omnitrophota bacterium]
MKQFITKLGVCKKKPVVISISRMDDSSNQKLIFHSCLSCLYSRIMIDPFSCPEFKDQSIEIIESKCLPFHCVGFDFKI